jgi:MFS family permease
VSRLRFVGDPIGNARPVQVAEVSVDQMTLRQLSDQATVRLLNKPGTVSSSRGGWMMIATILIEAWDLYAISFLLIFIKDEYDPTAAQLGLATAAVQGGALIGALLGGVVADRLGRKRVFVLTMILFIVLALAQGFSQNIWDLIIIRFLIGIPLGSDIANGYAYIMESMSKGAREQMGSRWQFMFGLGEVLAIVVITLMNLTGMGHGILWRIGLALGAVPALVLLLYRLDLPETPLSLLNRGQFRKAKRSPGSCSTTRWRCCPTRTCTWSGPRSATSSRSCSPTRSRSGPRSSVGSRTPARGPSSPPSGSTSR